MMDLARELGTRQKMIEALCDGSRYPHPAEDVEVVETHISWLLLTGEYAYKVKKPVDLGFVDFSTLERRHFFCEEELRLNRRFAPELYLKVVSIVGSVTNPHVGSEGEPLEYAVKMRQFPKEARLDRVLTRGELKRSDCDRIAETIAAGHAIAEVASSNHRHGLPEATNRRVFETLAIADERLPKHEQTRIEAIRHWCEQQFAAQSDLMHSRRAEGFVRECHGDLHLENMVLLAGQVVMFDCLEFNPDLRWIDTMSDVAFVTMDLADRGEREMAGRLLNRYVELTGDFAGLRLLPYYQVYRAVVRAAVAGMTLQQRQSEPDRRTLLAKADEYLKLAMGFTAQTRPVLVITHGCSGAGKSTVTQRLLGTLGAIRLRSDVERLRFERSRPVQSAPGDRYSAANRTAVYESMAATAETILRAGLPVLVDATFLRRADRYVMQALAALLDIPFVILRFTTSADELRARVARRARNGTDASEATVEVLEEQLRLNEPLTNDELAMTIDIVTMDDAELRRLAASIDERRR